jgi:hypothetical protein
VISRSIASVIAVALGGVAVICESAATAQAMLPSMPAPFLGGTPVELMVTKEVDSQSAKEGDRFKLRVNSPVIANGIAVVPVGATAWGEVTYVNGPGAAGIRVGSQPNCFISICPAVPWPSQARRAPRAKLIPQAS